ncbi:TetR/AcrR family transcriptional regulator [Tabrizicola sp. M-4]|uniref:TetR/AcrR family transcriptional regulator n=1 Tax=Tabrizicola sp. M-4 TaxID=3055847 RepID=UPI003DA7B739
MTDDDTRRGYHHGDLRSALLRAAEEELTERGVEAFSLRQVARRAGVSHAAPAHHFGDTRGLLTALAAEGFHRFLAAQGLREAQAAPDPRAQLTAAGLGYIDFAMQRPALFRLLFGSDQPDFSDPTLDAAATAAYDHLRRQVADAGGDEVAAAAAWAMAHGLADLLSNGRLKAVAALPPAARDQVLMGLLEQSFPPPVR